MMSSPVVGAGNHAVWRLSKPLTGVKLAGVTSDLGARVARAFRVRGHLAASLDPLGLPRPPQVGETDGGGTGGPFDSLGIGAWLLFATVIFLAFRGVMRFLARG